MPSHVKRVIVVDDHPLVRRGLVELLRDEQDLNLCGEAPSASEALRMIEQVRPDLVIIDLTLKEGSGLDLIKQIKARYPEVQMLVASMHDEAIFAERALRAGADGYFNKQEPSETLLKAIREVLAGHLYVSGRMADRLLHRALRRGDTGANPALRSLTDREMEVLDLIGEGLSTRQIASRLHLSIKTVHTHRDALKKKLQCTTAAELTYYAISQRLTEGRDAKDPPA